MKKYSGVKLDGYILLHRLGPPTKFCEEYLALCAVAPSCWKNSSRNLSSWCLLMNGSKSIDKSCRRNEIRETW